MALHLPDPPESLPESSRAFYGELRKMLAVVEPRSVDDERSAVKFDDDGLELRILHAEHDDVAIWVGVDADEAMVATGGAHEHFSDPTEAVDFVAEILRGQIEVETTYRGSSAISVNHFRVEESGERVSFGHTGFLTPARLLFWKPKRAETERVSFL